MTFHNILTFLTIAGVSIFLVYAMRKIDEHDRHDRKRQKNAAAK